MLPSPSNSRDPRLAMQNVSAVQNEHSQPAPPMQLLRWDRAHSPTQVSSNFLFITNLNDNITEAILKDELSRSGTIRHVRIPIIDGRSAGIASVLLPSNNDPNSFVSSFHGTSMFGKKLSVKSDEEAREFQNALDSMQCPGVPATQDCTPPTKDSRPDSNSPNWSLASQSDIEQPLSPVGPPAAKPPLSPVADGRKEKPWRSKKRPRTRYETDRHVRNGQPKRRFLTKEYSPRQSTNPMSNIHDGKQSHHPRIDEHRSSQQFSQSRRYMDSRDFPRRSDPREYTCTSRSDFAPRSPFLYSPDRNARHDMYSSASRNNKCYGHAGMPYYANRREHGLPHRRFDDVYRDFHEHGASREYSTYSSGKRPRYRSSRSGYWSDRVHFDGGPSISPGEYPSIVLFGVPSDISDRDIHRSFTEFGALCVVQKDTKGLYHVLFNDSNDREEALRYGCFTFSGVRIKPKMCLTRIPNRSWKGGVPPSCSRTASDERFVSSYRGPKGSERGEYRYNHDSGKTRNVDSNSNGFRQNTIASSQDDVKSSSRNVNVNRHVDQRAESGTKGIRHTSETRSTELKTELSKPAAHKMEIGKEGPHNPTCEPSRIERKALSSTLEPVANAVKPHPPDASDSLSAFSPGGICTKRIAAGHHLDDLQGNKHRGDDHRSKGEQTVPANGFQSENELFEAVLCLTIDRVSKQHAELEMKRCDALVARSVFEFVSAKKAEKKNIRPNENKNDPISRVPRSANAFYEHGFGSPPEFSPRKAKASAKVEARQESGIESARKRIRKSRFADIPDPETTSSSQGNKLLADVHLEAEPEKEGQPDSCLDTRGETRETLPQNAGHVNESEISTSTVLKSSQDSLDKSKSDEQTNAMMEESHGPAEKAEHPLSHSVDICKDTKHFLDTDSPTIDTEVPATDSGLKESSASNNHTSLSVEKSDDGLPTKQIRASTSDLDKVLETKTNYRHSKSSLLKSLHTGSGLPSLGLFSRQAPPKTVTTPTPEASIVPTPDPKPAPEPACSPAPQLGKQEDISKPTTKVGHAIRARSSKASASTKKQSRKNGKAAKIKKDRKTRRGTTLQLRKTRSSSSTVPTSPACDQVELYIAPEAVQGIQTFGKEIDSSDKGPATKSSVKRSVVESEGQQSELDVSKDGDVTDTNVDDRDGKCARTELYIRGQNKNKRRKRLRLETLSGKSALSSRQCRQESRLYRKGVSKIKPKNDDFINLNSLQQRWKKVQFDRSQIHGMGLYAKENIEPDEFVIEYIGDLIRRTVADLREKEYTRQGMGDSYLFRLNWDTVIDATRRGGIARFINHSCDPNVIARKITADGRSTIAFYSKRAISIGEELTYDYKFDYEAEDKKIPCLCGAANCRKYLN